MSRAIQYIYASLFAAVSAMAFSVDARAYTETPSAPPPQQQQQVAPAVPVPENLQNLPGVIVQPPPAGAEFNLTPGGKEIVIPGIGEVGTLPKLDFGLDLLYGSSSPQAQQKEEPAKSDDVMIKGTLKHRF